MITAAVTRDAVEELGIAGVCGNRHGEGNVGDGRGPILIRAGAVIMAALLISACGEGDGADRASSFSAARHPTEEGASTCSRDFPDADVRLQFAGSDELAAQLRRGVRPDVFAAANTSCRRSWPRRAAGPVVFATNELVLAVPAGTDHVRSLKDLRNEGTKLAIGSESVPVGSYTREVLSAFQRPRAGRSSGTSARRSRT